MVTNTIFNCAKFIWVSNKLSCNYVNPSNYEHSDLIEIGNTSYEANLNAWYFSEKNRWYFDDVIDNIKILKNCFKVGGHT